MKEFHLIWTVNGKVIHGNDLATGKWADEIFSFGPLFPGTVTDWKSVFVTSSAGTDRTDFVIGNICLRLQADAETLATLNRLAISGHGVQVSFNEGKSYVCLSMNPTHISPHAIITNPGTVLGPYDTARFHFRVSIPEDFVITGKLPFRINLTFDVM